MHGITTTTAVLLTTFFSLSAAQGVEIINDNFDSPSYDISEFNSADFDDMSFPKSR